MSRLFYCPYLETTVELSEDREQHVIESHPGTLPDYLSQLSETLGCPDLIRRSTRDEKSLLCSRWFDTIRTGRYLVVVVISQDDKPLPWIITAYTARKIAGGGIQIWPMDA